MPAPEDWPPLYQIEYGGRGTWRVVRRLPTIIAEGMKKEEAEALAKALTAEHRGR